MFCVRSNIARERGVRSRNWTSCRTRKVSSADVKLALLTTPSGVQTATKPGIYRRIKGRLQYSSATSQFLWRRSHVVGPGCWPRAASYLAASSSARWSCSEETPAARSYAVPLESAGSEAESFTEYFTVLLGATCYTAMLTAETLRLRESRSVSGRTGFAAFRADPCDTIRATCRTPTCPALFSHRA